MPGTPLRPLVVVFSVVVALRWECLLVFCVTTLSVLHLDMDAAWSLMGKLRPQGRGEPRSQQVAEVGPDPGLLCSLFL